MYVYVDICIYSCVKLITRVTIKPLGEKTHFFFFFFFFEVIYLIITCCCTPACSLSLCIERSSARLPPLVSWSFFRAFGTFVEASSLSLSLFQSFALAHLASVATGSFLIGLTGSLAFAPPAPACCCCACIAACAVGKLCNS